MVPALIGLALLLSALEASQLYFRAALEGWPVTAPSVLGRALASWLTFAALTPLALAAARRWPLHRPLLGRHLVPHLVAAAVFALLHLLTTAAILTQVLDHPFGLLLGYLVVAYLAVDLLLYLVIVGGWHVLEARRQLSAREWRASRLEHDLKRAQLEALNLQLQPHFLFNTLNAIAGLALRDGAARTADAVALLGDLLRENLSPGAAGSVPLREEIRLLERYFEVWRLRLGDQVRLQASLAPETAGLRVPRFLLQPLIENAVVHGILPAGGARQITVRSALAGNALELLVEDDGSGLAAATAGRGVGLTNVRERLAHLYGDAGGLTLTPRAGGGTLVRVVLPASEENEEPGT